MESEQRRSSNRNCRESSVRTDQPGRRVSTRFNTLPLAAKPNSTMLMTIKERWFHWEKEKKRASRTS